MSEPFLMQIAALGLALAVICFLIGRYVFPHKRNAMKEAASELRAQVSRLENAFATVSTERDRLLGERDMASGRASEAEARLAAFSERDRLLRERLDREAAQSERVVASAKTEFEALGNRLLQTMAEQMSETSSKKVADIVEPLGSRLTEFRERIEMIYGAEARDRYALQKEIQQVAQAGVLFGRQAEDLAKVLRVESRVQGRWGEVVLERVLEHSGLAADVMYLKKDSAAPIGDKTTPSPDAAIILPGDKHIIVDAQAPLGAYEAYGNATSGDDRSVALSDLTRALREHVDRLAANDYSTNKDLHPHEFVLMFVPAEGALAAALSSDSGLFTYAWDKGVIIVSPTSLMMTLRTIADLWRHEMQRKNVLSIIADAGALHDEICAFLDDMTSVGSSVDGAQAAYRAAVHKLSNGSASILSHAKALREKGSGSRRELPSLGAPAVNGGHEAKTPNGEVSEAGEASEPDDFEPPSARH